MSGRMRIPRAMLAAALLAASLPATVPVTSAGASLAWGPETNVTQTATDSEWGLGHRGIATTPDGTMHVVWAERDGPESTYRIWTRRLDGGAWSAPELLVDYLASDPGGPGDDIGAKYPTLADAPNGELHLFWHDYRVAGIDNVELFWKMRPAGGAWDPSRAADVRLTTSEHPETPGQNAYVPVPAVAPDGAVHVTWYDYRFDASLAEILSRTRPAGGAWDLTPGDGADERVTNDTAHSELADTAVDAVGNLHTVWRSVDAGGRVGYAMRDVITEAYSAPVFVDAAGTVAGAPTVAVDGAGTVHVVWPDSRDGGRALFTRTRDSAGTWSASPARITRPSEGADEPSLVAADDGTLHLVFSDGRVSLLNREVFHRAKAPGAGWDSTGAGDRRLSNASGNSSRPAVDVTGGIVTVAWKDARDGNHEVYVCRATPDGTGLPLPFAGASPPGLHAWPNPTHGAAVRFTA
ncbi:BNR repeat-containing protein, partial [bacterium]|nr:BNR repeat-containing protein [bacterium]